MPKRSSSRSSGGSSPLESRSPSPSAYAEAPRPGVDTELSSHNVGHAMLLKMGWMPGKGLGVEGNGRVQPVPISEKRGADLTGIGKASFDRFTIDKATSQRRELNAERMLNETESQRIIRLEEAERQATIQQDVLEARAAFRCELCDKGYSIPSAYDAHLTSYDHHHKKRLKELHAAEKARTSTSGALDKRRAKEAAREAKEMAKLAGAAGVALAPGAAVAPLPASSAQASSSGGGGWKSVASGSSSGASSGWKSVASTSKGGGWSAVGASATGGPSSSAPVAQAAPQHRTTGSTAFKSSGFSTLDTTEAAGGISPFSAQSNASAPAARSGFAPIAARAAPTGLRSSGFAPVSFSAPSAGSADASRASNAGTSSTSTLSTGFRTFSFAQNAAPPPPPGSPPPPPPPPSSEPPPPPPEPSAAAPPPPPPGPPPGPPPSMPPFSSRRC